MRRDEQLPVCGGLPRHEHDARMTDRLVAFIRSIDECDGEFVVAPVPTHSNVIDEHGRAARYPNRKALGVRISLHLDWVVRQYAFAVVDTMSANSPSIPTLGDSLRH